MVDNGLAWKIKGKYYGCFTKVADVSDAILEENKGELSSIWGVLEISVEVRWTGETFLYLKSPDFA